jgi:hypothetical protein
MIALGALGVLPVDAVQEHGQLGGTQADAGLIGADLGEVEAALLQPLEARITLPSC